LEVYRLGFEAAMRIFELTKDFPKEERYSLTDQIRRSSRSARPAMNRRATEQHPVNGVLKPKRGLEAGCRRWAQTWIEFA
jgi:hypothetical protein